MIYATKTDMINRYGQQLLIELTDRADPPTNVIVDAVLDLALADASALIDSYISRRYSLPLTVLPAALRKPCEAIAWFDLHRGRYTEESRAAFDDAMKYLAAISAGIVVLDVGGAQPASAPAEAIKDGPDRTFSRATLVGY